MTATVAIPSGVIGKRSPGKGPRAGAGTARPSGGRGGAATHLAGDLERKQRHDLEKSHPGASVRPRPFSSQPVLTSDLASSTGSLNGDSSMARVELAGPASSTSASGPRPRPLTRVEGNRFLCNANFVSIKHQF